MPKESSLKYLWGSGEVCADTPSPLSVEPGVTAQGAGCNSGVCLSTQNSPLGNAVGPTVLHPIPWRAGTLSATQQLAGSQCLSERIRGVKVVSEVTSQEKMLKPQAPPLSGLSRYLPQTQSNHTLRSGTPTSVLVGGEGWGRDGVSLSSPW